MIRTAALGVKASTLSEGLLVAESSRRPDAGSLT